MQNLVRTAALLCAALVVAPSLARAEGFVTPWAGVNFGNKVADGRTAVGVNAGVMGGKTISSVSLSSVPPCSLTDSYRFGNLRNRFPISVSARSSTKS